MIYLMLGTGFEVTEAMVPLVMMRRAGIDVCTVGINGKTVVGSRDIPIVADITIEEMDLTNLEGIVLPGGLGGVASIKARMPSASLGKTASWWRPSAPRLRCWQCFTSPMARRPPAIPAVKPRWEAQ